MMLDGNEKCECPKSDCKRHGKCDECIHFHKTHKLEPYCMRKKSNLKNLSFLGNLPNIGKQLMINLNLAGIHTSQQLKSCGSHRAFMMLRTVDSGACLSALCALEGAIQGVRWHSLSSEIKAELKTFFKAIKD